MAKIGELFKVLGNNQDFLNYIVEGHKNNQTVKEIIDVAITNEALMTILMGVIDDVSVIMSKMDIVISQKIKGINAAKNKKEENKESNNVENRVELVIKEKKQQIVKEDESDDGEWNETWEEGEWNEDWKKEQEKRDDDEEKDDDLFAHMIHKPVNKENVVWLWRTCYLERVGSLMRLIHNDHEMFY